MSKTVAIHQPDFMPYLGFFHRLLYCDIFIILDHVQFLKKGWHCRDKIKSPKGEAVWLSVPVKNKIKIQPINKVQVDTDESWKKKHLNILKAYYIKAPYLKEIFPLIENIYLSDIDLMVDFNLAFINLFIDIFEIKVDIKLSSDMQVETKKNQMNIDLVKKVDGSVYLSGIGAKDYIDEDSFNNQGVELIWQNFNHPVYPQVHGDFIPFLSSIDLLFNCGIENSREILRSI